MDDDRTLSVPLMDEEIGIIEEEGYYIFNFPYEFYQKYIKPLIAQLSPEYIKNVTLDCSRRVILRIHHDKGGDELRIWVLLKIEEEDNYFITEL